MKKLFLLVPLFLFATTAFDCGGNGGGGTAPPKDDPKAPPEVRTAARFHSGQMPITDNPTTVTPKGCYVHGLPQPTAEMQAAIDRGVGGMLTDAWASMAHNDTRTDNFGFYHYYFPTNGCSPSPESKTPSFVLRNDAYDGLCDEQGNTFDYWNPAGNCVKDGIGVVYAPEAVFNLGQVGSTPANAQILICPNPELIETEARYGGEHVKILAEDGQYFNETAVHGPPHPLLPKPSARIATLKGGSKAPMPEHKALPVKNGVIYVVR